VILPCFASLLAEEGCPLVTGRRSQVALPVQSDAAADGLAGADAIDGLVHLAVSPVAALDRVGGGRQQRIVQERQGLFEMGREQLAE